MYSGTQFSARWLRIYLHSIAGPISKLFAVCSKALTLLNILISIDAPMQFQGLCRSLSSAISISHSPKQLNCNPHVFV